MGEVDGLQGVAFLPPRAGVQWWERWMGFRVWRLCPLELVFSGGRGGWASGCGVPAPRAGLQWWERWMGFRVWRSCPLELVFSGVRGGWASGCGVPAP